MKAVALFSGGLDSTLAIKVILEQGIEVIALNFMSPFCRCDKYKGCGSTVKKMADELGVEFKRFYLGQDYLDMVKNPQRGYGKNLNPCIDCRIFKFSRARQFMKEAGASFAITGEVLGQRPMSQHRQALKTIEKRSGLEGLILRPLSAKLFPETLPEQKGWVDRNKLLAISGRGRRPQIELASSFGIKDYPCPAGGCLLTDSSFCKRLRDLFKYEEFDTDNAELLKIGRHFRITPEFKLIVGRNEQENARLANSIQGDDLCFEPKELPGPFGLGKGVCNNGQMQLCAQIIARYTSEDEVEVIIKGATEEVVSVKGIEEDKCKELMV